jgi:hypothetical protein
MFPNDALHNRQTDACAFKISGMVQPLKNAERLARILHLETTPLSRTNTTRSPFRIICPTSITACFRLEIPPDQKAFQL